ncbi:hypothetical protein T484DRAFT_1847214 [Baffinella frigidus]|nr:hypothetical protein T484DRAFT_1847214 [Cryptophyta sp. CCMP2293]
MVHTFKHSQVNDVPVDKVFPVFADGGIDLLTPEQKMGVGAKRRCNFKDNSSVVEECLATETNTLVHMKLEGPSFPIKTLDALFRFEDKGAQTVVTMEMQITVPPALCLHWNPPGFEPFLVQIKGPGKGVLVAL